jgi:hypothetical protein
VAQQTGKEAHEEISAPQVARLELSQAVGDHDFAAPGGFSLNYELGNTK